MVEKKKNIYIYNKKLILKIYKQNIYILIIS